MPAVCQGRFEAPPCHAGLDSKMGDFNEQPSSWAAQKRNVLRIFELWREENGGRNLLPRPFAELHEDEVCRTEVFDKFAEYLASTYVIESGRNKGEHLALGPATNYLRSMMNMVSDKFKATGSYKTKNFLTCLDVNARTESALWFGALCRKMKRHIYQRTMVAGDEMDQSATPVYGVHIEKAGQAYAKEGSAEVNTSLLRKSPTSQQCRDGTCLDSSIYHL